MELSGSSAIVTGGASGIGAAAARQLAAQGATVVVADLQADKGEALAEEIKGVFAQVDVTNTDQIAGRGQGRRRHRAAARGRQLGRHRLGPAHDRPRRPVESAHDLGAFTKVIQINLIGTFDMVRQAATAMSLNEPDADGCRGAIVNLASVAAFDGQIGQASYSASKGGVVGMTLPVARDLSAVRHPAQHRRPRPDRHPDLRRGPGLGGVQGQPRPERALPQAPRHARRAGQHGDGVPDQLAT